MRLVTCEHAEAGRLTVLIPPVGLSITKLPNHIAVFFHLSLLRNTASYTQTSNGQTKLAELVSQLIFDGEGKVGLEFWA